ncbi:MAG: GNAT family N-acetyltransferase [Candidatus Competibacter sp.]
MSTAIKYLWNKASEAEIVGHLLCCDSSFVPSLSSRVEIDDYAQKIVSKAMRFEAWSGRMLIGLVAAYCNDYEKYAAYITSVSLLKSWTGRGIAVCLVRQCIEYAKVLGMRQISLNVASDNMPAIKLYGKCGFIAGKANNLFITMTQHLEFGYCYE